MIDTTNILEPTKQCSLFDGRVQFLGFGRPTNYSNFLGNKVALATVVGHAKRLGVTEIYMPNPKESNAVGVMAAPEIFPEHVEIDGVAIHAGAMVDCVRLTKPFTAVHMLTGDCPVLSVLLPDESIVVSHAARASLVDQKAILSDGGKTRKQEGVVFTSLVGWRKSELASTQAALCCGIGPQSFDHPFTHPTHGQSNKKLVMHLLREWGEEVVSRPHQFGRINLLELVRAQLAKCGVTNSKALIGDGVDTYGDMSANGRMWHSNRAGDASRNSMLISRLR